MPSTPQPPKLQENIFRAFPTTRRRFRKLRGYSNGLQGFSIAFSAKTNWTKRMENLGRGDIIFRYRESQRSCFRSRLEFRKTFETSEDILEYSECFRPLSEVFWELSRLFRPTLKDDDLRRTKEISRLLIFSI